MILIEKKKVVYRIALINLINGFLQFEGKKILMQFEGFNKKKNYTWKKKNSPLYLSSYLKCFN